MINYVSGIFDRVNLQHIREFLLSGTECLEISDKTYEERIEESHEKTMKPMEIRFSDMDEEEALLNDIYSYVATVEAVYMEIGMQCGVALAIKLLSGAKS